MDPGILAAIHKLPKYENDIKGLALRSESFRSLCSDLADIEQAIQRHRKPQTPEQAAQLAEYRHLAEGLEAELRQALAAIPPGIKARTTS